MAENTPAPARIVVGVDPSDNAAAAAAWAAREAADRELTLHLMYAVNMHTAFGALPEPSEAGQPERKAADELLASVAERLSARFPRLTITTAVSPMSAGETMVACTRTSELVVTGTRGHGGFAGMLLGSVSLKLAAHAHCPVVVVRGESLSEERNEVVVGVEPGQDPAAVRFAFETAVRYGASVRVVRAWWPELGYGKFSAAPGVPDQHKVEAAGLASVLESVREHFPQVEVIPEIGFGNSVTILLNAARGARLLVVGAHRSHGPLSVGAGYTVQGVLAHSPTPVAVVPVGA